ncbi:MAG TPA: hypothetical protein VFQ39_07835 [Longimicrobium sp.]|nr:hypothetical protein [Longimicrobium sp.]
MTTDEVRAARERLGLTPGQMAREYGVTEGEVRLWERRPGTIPKLYARRLAWEVAARDQEQRLAAAGLPRCERVELLATHVTRATGREEARVLEELAAHGETCALCQARDRFARTLPPLPKPPQSVWMDAWDAFDGALSPFPAWVRAAAYGAAIGTAFGAVAALGGAAGSGFRDSLGESLLLVGGYALFCALLWIGADSSERARARKRARARASASPSSPATGDRTA